MKTTAISAPQKPKPGLVREFDISDIRPSPENDKLYSPINHNSPDILALANSISQYRIKEPLVITKDGYIVSGHRRFVAAGLAGLLTVPCRVEPINRNDDIDAFIVLLREYNRQREKTFDEKLREEVVTASANPDQHAYEAMIEERKRRSDISVDGIEIVGKKHRCNISDNKRPMLDAAIRAVNERREFWPISDRTAHYAILSDPPLRHSKKPDSRYANTVKCYKDLCDLLTRARLTGEIPMDAINDDTRPQVHYEGYGNAREFIRQQLDQFMDGYYRNLQQSQPNHIEVLGEKNTLMGILKPVVSDYCVPLTLGRGYCSLPPRRDIARRYQESGKEKLLLLLVNDFDPEGEDIPHSMARSMRDDFGIANVHAIKVALTKDQIRKYHLPEQMTAKVKSSRASKFSSAHGSAVYELEALDAQVLQQLLRDAIDSVLDVELFNRELAQEKEDAGEISGVRKLASKLLGAMGGGR